MVFGIVTCWKPDDNYGTQIQCFALQNYLRGLGHQAFLIRYDRDNDLVRIPMSQRKLINIINPVKIFRVLYVAVLSSKLKKTGDNHNRNAPAFREKYLSQSKEYPNYEALVRDPPEADVYIVGSDQVWNINYRQVNNLKAHFLAFGPDESKRISYAASFGFGPERLTDDYKNAVLPLLSRFDAVSVRESSGVDICGAMGIQGAVQVCDPTMLIRPEEYLDYFRDEKMDIPAGEYVLVYNLSATSDLDIYAIKRWAEQKDYKLLYITGHGKADKVEKIYPSVPEWVCLIANAKYVITNSYHGSVFALMFHKALAVFPVTGKAFGNPNSRIETLERLTGKPLIVDRTHPFEAILSHGTDWGRFEKNKEALVARGKSFLARFGASATD